MGILNILVAPENCSKSVKLLLKESGN